MESMIFKWGLNEVSMRSQWDLKWDLIRQAMVTLKIRPHMDFHQTSWDLIRAPGVLWNTMYFNALQCIVLRCIAAQSVECNSRLRLLRGGVCLWPAEPWGIPPPPPPRGADCCQSEHPVYCDTHCIVMYCSTLYCNISLCIPFISLLCCRCRSHTPLMPMPAITMPWLYYTI